MLRKKAEIHCRLWWPGTSVPVGMEDGNWQLEIMEIHPENPMEGASRWNFTIIRKQSMRKNIPIPPCLMGQTPSRCGQQNQTQKTRCLCRFLSYHINHLVIFKYWNWLLTHVDQTLLAMCAWLLYHTIPSGLLLYHLVYY